MLNKVPSKIHRFIRLKTHGFCTLKYCHVWIAVWISNSQRFGSIVRSAGICTHYLEPELRCHTDLTLYILGGGSGPRSRDGSPVLEARRSQKLMRRGDSKYPSVHIKAAFVSKETCRRDQSPHSYKAERFALRTCMKVSTYRSYSQAMCLNTFERRFKLLHLDIIVQKTSSTLRVRRV